MYKSYADEANIQRGDPYCTVAGYSADVTEWAKFEAHWRFVLNEYMRDFPERERYFHALEFYDYSSKSKYAKWTQGKRRSFIDALFKVISDFNLPLFSSTIDARVFFSLTEDERRFLSGGLHNGMRWKTHGAPTKQYFLPFQFCIIQAASFVPDGDVVFPVMSRQAQYEITALELYEAFLNSEPALNCRSKLADDMVFSDPRTVPGLQAADLAVYWFGQLWKYRAKTGNRLDIGFPNMAELRQVLRNMVKNEDLKLFDFNGLMLLLQGTNRYTKSSFLTLDQMFPSLPLQRRMEVLGAMRKVSFRRFSGQWQPSALEDRD
jgi:hypothetical protein